MIDLKSQPNLCSGLLQHNCIYLFHLSSAVLLSHPVILPDSVATGIKNPSEWRNSLTCRWNSLKTVLLLSRLVRMCSYEEDIGQSLVWLSTCLQCTANNPTPPHNKNYPVQNVHSAKVEKPCSNQRVFYKTIFSSFIHLFNKYLLNVYYVAGGLPWWFSRKKSICNADEGSISGWGWSPAEGNGNLPSILAWKNPMDRGSWSATAHEVARIRHDLETK